MFQDKNIYVKFIHFINLTFITVNFCCTRHYILTSSIKINSNKTRSRGEHDTGKKINERLGQARLEYGSYEIKQGQVCHGNSSSGKRCVMQITLVRAEIYGSISTGNKGYVATALLGREQLC